jgi:L-asparaginase II
MTAARFRRPAIPDVVPLLVVTRGGEVESVHRGSVAVVSEDGHLLAGAGDPLQPVFLRSAAKPFQLTPFLAAGGERRFRLTTEEIALAAASHGGEPFHTRTAARMLERGGFSAADLHCGAHAPMREDTARALAFRHEKATPLHNNCSGKHAAMLLACRMFRLDPKTYYRAGHPLQRKILSVVSRMTGVPEDRIPIGVDGCSVPVHQVPLYNLALSYARLVGARADGETAAEFAARRRIVAAMTRAPRMVAGTGRFTTNLMTEFGGALLAKEGAEGVYAVGVPRRLARALPVRGAIGIALKIEDGAERGRDAVTVEVMRQLGLASGALLANLRRLARRPVRNVRGDVVGGMKPVFSLDLFAAAGAAADASGRLR